MADRLSIGVMGAGSIGCHVGGRIAVSEAADVVFIGRARLAEEIAANGLTVKDLDRPADVLAPGRVRFETTPEALADVDVVLCAVKSAQTEAVATTLAELVAPKTVIVSLQNGVVNPQTLREHLPACPVLAGIVGYNVVSRGEGLFHRTMDGPLIIEQHPAAADLFDVIRQSKIDLEVRDDIAPEQWTKLLVNLNNAVSALSDAPTPALLASATYRRIVAALIDEGLMVIRASGLKAAKLRGVPVGLMPKILRLPNVIAHLALRAQMKVDPNARSSMWEDLTRGRPTEVDFLNGEIVRRADEAGVSAPLNRRIVELVHEAERAQAGSPALDAETFWAALHAAPNPPESQHR